MTLKHIMVLANSIKHNPCRCIAGREVVSVDGEYQFGAWVRPISNHGEGELNFQEMRMTNGILPRVGDAVSIPCQGPAGNLGQPEDWLIDATRCWSPSSISGRRMPDIPEEAPRDLWLEPHATKSDRVSEAYIMRNPPSQSLYIIKPTGLNIQFFTNDYGKKKSRACFEYNGTRYDLSMTDPEISHRHCPQVPAQGEEPIIVNQWASGEPLVCVSLAPAWNGYHYKLVATIFD